MTYDPYYHVDRLDKDHPEGWTKEDFDKEFKSDGYGPKSRDKWWTLLKQDKTFGVIRTDTGAPKFNTQGYALYGKCL